MCPSGGIAPSNEGITFWIIIVVPQQEKNAQKWWNSSQKLTKCPAVR
jgi:hypothetical protein